MWRASEGLEGLAAVPVDGSRKTQTNFARNFPRSFFETTRKRCNSNGTNSMFEVITGELRAKLLIAHVNPIGGGLGPFMRTLTRWVVAWAGGPPCHQ